MSHLHALFLSLMIGLRIVFFHQVLTLDGLEFTVLPCLLSLF